MAKQNTQPGKVSIELGLIADPLSVQLTGHGLKYDKELAAAYRKLANELEESHGSQFDFYKSMEDIDERALHSDSPGYGYNYTAMAKLSAIQERFAKCYAELQVPA